MKSPIFSQVHSLRTRPHSPSGCVVIFILHWCICNIFFPSFYILLFVVFKIYNLLSSFFFTSFMFLVDRLPPHYFDKQRPSQPPWFLIPLVLAYYCFYKECFILPANVPYSVSFITYTCARDFLE